MEYSIGELARLADVTVRTVRFYIAEGVLPPPMSGGRFAVYSDDHLARLRLIARLKGAFLPLHEIRARLEALDDRQVADLVSEAAAPSEAAMGLAGCEPVAAAMEIMSLCEAPSSASEYIARVLSSHRKTSPSPYAGRSRSQAPTERWERRELAPGLELHVRVPVEHAVRELVDEIEAAARRSAARRP